jgi:hypothetical protein
MGKLLPRIRPLIDFLEKPAHEGGDSGLGGEALGFQQSPPGPQRNDVRTMEFVLRRPCVCASPRCMSCMSNYVTYPYMGVIKI